MGATEGPSEKQMRAGASLPPSATRVFFPHVSPRKPIHETSPSISDMNANKGPNYGEHLRVTVCANQGGRKYMEDRVHIHCERDQSGKLLYTYVAVYDGHGGAEASVFTKEHLLDNIKRQRGFDSTNDAQILEAIKQGFLETHQAMERVVDMWPRTASGFRSTSGTTASVAFIRHGKVYSGHVGDSAIIVGLKPQGSDTMVGRSVTVDHKPDSPEELSRIECSGGRVQNKSGVMRVVWTRAARGHYGPIRRSTPQESIPFLAVARSLGDLWSYNEDCKEYIVSPNPDMDVFQLTNEHKCLILGSDGLWNVIKPQYSVDIVNAHEYKESSHEENNLDRPVHENHSRWLTRHCLRGWGNLRADNVTTITLIFDPLDSNLPANSECLAQTSRNLDIEQELTDHPEAMIRISPETTQVLRTGPVELLYCGSLDLPPSNACNGAIPHSSKLGNIVGTTFAYHNDAHFNGPGFTRFCLESSYYRRIHSQNTIRPLPACPPTSAARSPGGSDRSEPEDPQPTSAQKKIDHFFDKEKKPPAECPYVTSIESHSIVKFSLDGGPPKTNKSVANGRKKTYFCPKHASLCADDRITNNTYTDAHAEQKEDKLNCAKKYRCKKHGLECKKVKDMNKLQSEKMKEQKKEINGANGFQDEKHELELEPVKCQMSLRSTEHTTPSTPPFKPRVNGRIAHSHKHNDALLSTSILSVPRLTRSGAPLSPTKSAPPARRMAQRASASKVQTPTCNTPRRRASMQPRLIINDTKTMARKVRSMMNVDVRKSAHLFRVRKLRYCLRRQLTDSKLISFKAKKDYFLRSRDAVTCPSLPRSNAETHLTTPIKDLFDQKDYSRSVDRLSVTSPLRTKTPSNTAPSGDRKRKHFSEGKKETSQSSFKKFRLWKGEKFFV